MAAPSHSVPLHVCMRVKQRTTASSAMRGCVRLHVTPQSRIRRKALWPPSRGPGTSGVCIRNPVLWDTCRWGAFAKTSRCQLRTWRGVGRKRAGPCMEPSCILVCGAASAGESVGTGPVRAGSPCMACPQGTCHACAGSVSGQCACPQRGCARSRHSEGRRRTLATRGRRGSAAARQSEPSCAGPGRFKAGGEAEEVAPEQGLEVRCRSGNAYFGYTQQGMRRLGG
jgi:hypothetical protein